MFIGPKIFIVPIYFTCQQRMQGVMEFVYPLSIQAVATDRRRVDVSGIIEVKLCNENFFSSRLYFECANFSSKFVNERFCTVVPNRVDRIQSQTINVKFIKPH